MNTTSGTMTNPTVTTTPNINTTMNTTSGTNTSTTMTTATTTPTSSSSNISTAAISTSPQSTTITTTAPRPPTILTSSPMALTGPVSVAHFKMTINVGNDISNATIIELVETFFRERIPNGNAFALNVTNIQGNPQ
nr:integumentary mucin C.1-like [Nerophis lumbriciformis]